MAETHVLPIRQVSETTGSLNDNCWGWCHRPVVANCRRSPIMTSCCSSTEYRWLGATRIPDQVRCHGVIKRNEIPQPLLHQWASVQTITNETHATVVGIRWQHDVTHLNDATTIASCRAQCPAQRQPQASRVQGLQFFQHVDVQSIDKSVTPARLVAKTCVDGLSNAADLLRRG